MKLKETTSRKTTNVKDLYDAADSGKRFMNYILDILFTYILIYVINFIYAKVIGDTSRRPEKLIEYNRITILLMYIAHMMVFELIFKGRTFAKFLTKTKTVNQDGTKIMGYTAIFKTLLKGIPFLPVLVLFNTDEPFHDRVSKTKVIDC